MLKERGFLRVGKRGQFYILAALIIVSILVSLNQVKNSVTVAEAPAKFYYYSQMLEEETGAVVDHGLYTGNVYVGDFVQKGVRVAIGTYPDLEIYACYSDKDNSSRLMCQNNGTDSIVVSVGGETLTLEPTATTARAQNRNDPVAGTTCFSGVCYDSEFNPLEEASCEGIADDEPCVIETTITQGCGGICTGNFSIKNQNAVNITLANGLTYSLPIRNTSIQANQFYFIFRVNTSSGEFVDVSGDGISGEY